MKLGDLISSVATPLARTLDLNCIDPTTRQLRPESNCAKMRDQLNAAHYPRDYVNAVIDRLTKRGKYKTE